MIGSYPLTWPLGWPRVPSSQRRDGRFRTTLGVARDELLHELGLFGASDVLVSTDVPTRNDGLFYAGAREPDDPGVAVYFSWRGKPYHVACDSYVRLAQNVRAVHKTVEAWRTIERHGASQLLERVVSGFAALPPGSDGEPETPPPPWWEVLGIPQIGDATPVEIASSPGHILRRPFLQLAETIYKDKIQKAHPDRGGSNEGMLELNRAIADARAALGKDDDR